MRFYEIIIIALLLPVGYFLREIAYGRRVGGLHEAAAHLWRILRRWGSRKNHKNERR